MFKAIFLFELRYRLKRPATYVYLVVFLLLGLLIGALMGGAMGSDGATALTGGGKNMANSPVNLHSAITAGMYFAIFVVAAIMGVPIFRDFEHKTHSLFFTKPINKFGYLGGRFLGSFCITLLTVILIAVGIWVAFFLPDIQEEKLGSFVFYHYLHPYLIYLIPNIFLSSVLFFSFVALARNQLLIYLNAIILLLLITGAQLLANEIENETLAGLLDPFGDITVLKTIEDWTVFERNTQVIPLTGTLLYNRLIWFGVALSVLGFTFLRFRFTYALGTKAVKRVRRRKTASGRSGAVLFESIRLPKVYREFSFKNNLKQWWVLTKREFKGVFYSPVFIAIGVVYILFLILAAFTQGQVFETPTLPVTYQMISLDIPLFVIAVIIFYSGEMVWAERTFKINGMLDALPVPTWLPYFSKFFALMAIILVLQTIVIVNGVLVQTFSGYFHYEFGLYFTKLFVLDILEYLCLAALAFFVQAVSPSKFLGFFIFVGFYLLMGPGLALMGFRDSIYRFNQDSGYIYSDMNGFGHFLFPYLIYRLYWSALAICLATLTYILWPRGSEFNLKTRWANVQPNMTLGTRFLLIGSLAVFLAMGGYIYYNTHIVTEYLTAEEQQEEIADYEKKYKKYEGIPQPKIVDVSLQVDLFPHEQAFEVDGRFWLKNKTDGAIDSVHILLLNYGSLNVDTLGFDRSSKLARGDEGYRIYALEEPLAPNDSMQLFFTYRYEPRGFDSEISIVENGTFMNSAYFPSIGYNKNYELGGDDVREEQSLPPRDRVPSINDTTAWERHFISHDADWVRYEAVISTLPDQIAITPGYLQKEWEEDGRRYFHYKMDAPMLNFYNISSARYEVAKEQWEDINLEIYYHPGHDRNVSSMMEALKRGLAYYHENFSPYQHRQVRILEFPRYRGFAQSFANTFPYSEAIGFIADVDTTDKDEIDYPFYVVAHELAHQWWAHQVIGADVQGSQFLSETMSQYSALMVMKDYYGEDRMKKFLQLEMDNYLRGRAGENKREQPALLSEYQQYIHYNKGSVIMYALQDYIGEDSLNVAMERYIEKVGFQEAPYTTTQDWLRYVEEVTPSNLRYVLTDMFEEITLFDNKVESVEYEELDSTTFRLELAVQSLKLRADGLGEEDTIPTQDYIDIGVFRKEKVEGEWTEMPLYFEKHHITTAQDTFEIIVDKKPERAGIDPYNKLIDRKPGDNMMRVKER